jgi:hypothetical protein
MLTCPMCKKSLEGLVRECPRCRSDLSLLVDYSSHLQDGLVQAQALTRQGELGEAVWAYLTVLEVDPDNPEARRQVGRVVTAVRQFDRADPGRRWVKRLRRRARFRQWLHGRLGDGSPIDWMRLLFLLLLAAAALFLAFELGYRTGLATPPAQIEASQE